MAKRLFDIVFSFGWLVLFAPLMLVVALLVRLKLGSPVLFRQERPGLRGQPFRMVKFRTMTDERGPDGELLPDDVRLTSFGKFLRATTLDEFPEMWNVLVGDMSVVGPRPLLMRYFWLNLKIIVLTFFKVFARSGINSDKAATMEEFRGTDKG